MRQKFYPVGSALADSFRAFTVIELLVVIAIIGLLSSIIFVSLSGARGKARVARGLQFESSVKHIVGAYPVGWWDFDDQQDPTVDSSGYGNDGDIVGAQFKCTKDNTPSRKGCSLEFDGVDDYVEISDSPYLNPTEGITITFWLNVASDLNCDGDDNYDNWRSILHKGGYLAANPTGYDVVLEEDRWFVFDVGTVGGRMRYRTYGYYLGPLNEWIFFTGTYNSLTSEGKIYVDGRAVRTGLWDSWYINNGLPFPPSGGDILSNSYSLYINHSAGVSCQDGEGSFPGKIDNVRIYKEALTSAQIKKLYVEGLERHLTANSGQ